MATDQDFDGIIDPSADAGAPVPLLSTRALALGGPDGAMNAQAIALVKRLKAVELKRVDEASRNTWPTTAAALGQGVQGTSTLIGGTGGTDGTFPLTFSGGTQVIAPTGRFVVSGGSVVSVVIDYPGYYSAGTPTIGLSGSSGLAGASVVATMGPNVPVGGYFSVPSGVAGEALIIYRAAAGPSAVEISRTSSALALGVLNRIVPFLATPPADSSLQRVHDITLNDDVSLSGISGLYVRFAFRDSVGSGRFQFILSSWDGSASVDRIGVGASIASINPTGFTGQRVVDLVAVSNTAFSGYVNGQVVGTMRFDFGAGEDFAGAFAYADSALYLDKVKVPVGVRKLAQELADRTTERNALNRLLPYINTPRIGSTLLRLVGAPILKDDIDLSVYPKITVRNVFRDNPGTPRFNLLLSAFDGVSTYTPIIGVGPSTASIDPTGLVGQRVVPLVAVSGSAFPGYANGDLVGYAAIDFGAGEDFGPTFSYDHAAGGVYVDRLQISPGLRSAIDIGVDRKLSLSRGLKAPFVDQLGKDFLRRVIKNLWVYGADKNHQYIVGALFIERFTGFARFRMTIRDLTAGADVCSISLIDFSAPLVPDFLASLPKTLKLRDELVSPRSGVYAVAEFDWTGVTAPSATESTTYDEAGILPSSIYSDDDIADYLQQDSVHETIRVGAGMDFATFRAAVESLQINPGVDLDCHRSHYHHRIAIEIVDDATFGSTYVELPPFVQWRGNGVDRTIIVKENDGFHALVESHTETKVFDVTIRSDTGDGGSWVGEYCLHSDDVNRQVVGGKRQTRRLRQLYKRVKMIGGPNNNTALFGSGVSSGQTIRFEDCEGYHERDGVALGVFFFHNTGPTLSVPGLAPSPKPAVVEMVSTRTRDADGPGVYLQTLEASARCTLSLTNCKFPLIFNTVAGGGEVVTERAIDRFAWKISGVHSGAILQQDPEGMIVLGTTAGVAVSGSAAALIFGNIDELGRGDVWIKNGTVKSLGARLGDCSSINKTLVIGGQPHTFATDLTAASNASIISEINASITANPVSEVDIQIEQYPDVGYTLRVRNSTGSTLDRGRFAVRSGPVGVAYANGVSRVLGWIPRAIRNTFGGDVITARRVHSAYITGASADGEFGVTGGLLDYGASPKVGRVESGIVILY